MSASGPSKFKTTSLQQCWLSSWDMEKKNLFNTQHYHAWEWPLTFQNYKSDHNLIYPYIRNAESII